MIQVEAKAENKIQAVLHQKGKRSGMQTSQIQSPGGTLKNIKENTKNIKADMIVILMTTIAVHRQIKIT